MPTPATSKRGRNGEAQAALLRVKTGLKALRAVEGAFLNCGKAREKINQPEHTTTGSQNKGTEKLQRAGPSPLEVGGGGRGKGQTQPQRSHPLPPGKQAPVPD